jgi:hypothetical protein
MYDTPVLLRAVCYCRAFLVGILLLALPARVASAVRSEGLSLAQWSLDTDPRAGIEAWTHTLDPAIEPSAGQCLMA